MNFKFATTKIRARSGFCPRHFSFKESNRGQVMGGGGPNPGGANTTVGETDRHTCAQRVCTSVGETVNEGVNDEPTSAVLTYSATHGLTWAVGHAIWNATFPSHVSLTAVLLGGTKLNRGHGGTHSLFNFCFQGNNSTSDCQFIRRLACRAGLRSPGDTGSLLPSNCISFSVETMRIIRS